MLKTVFAVALLCLFSVEANARQRAPALHPDCNKPGYWPCAPVTASTPEQARVTRGRYISNQMGFGAPVKERHGRVRKGRVSTRWQPIVRQLADKRLDRQIVDRPHVVSIASTIARPARYIAGRLICAVNVNAALAERGIRGTGSALALSFRTWGRSAGGPVPGAVIVSARRGGGHVAIVSRVERGVVFAWNASGGQRGWREIPYRHHVIDYRVPG